MNCAHLRTKTPTFVADHGPRHPPSSRRGPRRTKTPTFVAARTKTDQDTHLRRGVLTEGPTDRDHTLRCDRDTHLRSFTGLRTCIASPKTRPLNRIKNHCADTAFSDRPIPAAAHFRGLRCVSRPVAIRSVTLCSATDGARSDGWQDGLWERCRGRSPDR
jgi:hypothetical protein